MRACPGMRPSVYTRGTRLRYRSQIFSPLILSTILRVSNDLWNRSKETIKKKEKRLDPVWEKRFGVFDVFFGDPLSRSEFASGKKRGQEIFLFSFPFDNSTEGERRSRVQKFSRNYGRRLFPFVADNKKALASTRFLESSVEKKRVPVFDRKPASCNHAAVSLSRTLWLCTCDFEPFNRK